MFSKYSMRWSSVTLLRGILKFKFNLKKRIKFLQACDRMGGKISKNAGLPTGMGLSQPNVFWMFPVTVPPSPKFHPLHSMASCFRVTGHFETRTLKHPQNDMNPTCYNYPKVPNFHPFCSMTGLFRLILHLETSAPNYLKVNLILKGQRCPIYVL